MSVVERAGATRELAGAMQREARGLQERNPGRVGPRQLALAAILALSAALEFVRLGQNGYANTYYSAAVKSMLLSLHNFFFIAADPNGLITVDKPPLALWLQALSAKIFGFAPLSLLLPQGVCAVLAVALLYRIVSTRFGAVAGLVAALSLAVFPSFVAVGRDNGVDPLLILLMVAACGAGIAATESGRPHTLLWSAVLAGLAFETKSLASLLCVPGIAVAFLACAPGSLRRRICSLAAAALVLLVVAGCWSLAVDLTPASQRPFVGGSTASNSELQLEFGYNGIGRVVGQAGGPGTPHTLTPSDLFPLIRPGVTVAATPGEKRYWAEHSRSQPAPASPPKATTGSGRHRNAQPVPFAGARSPLRIFGLALGGQAGWLVPLALVGMLAIALATRGRRDRRTAMLVIFGGWMALELLTLDFSSGIVHPYYASALGPGVAVMVGGGVAAITSLLARRPTRRRALGMALAAVGVAGTVAVELLLIARASDPTWWRIPLVALCVPAVAVMPFLRERAPWALAAAVAALLVAPLAYSMNVWLAPVNGTFPAAGPYSNAGYGGIGVAPAVARVDRELVGYLAAHGATKPYALLTESSEPAAPLILLGLDASSEGGYGASDQALSASGLATLVATRKARYLLLEGPFALRAGNSAIVAARLVCTEIPQIIWGGGAASGSLLVDCAGRAAALHHPYQFARRFLRAHPEVHYPLRAARPN
jgi:4-amino-4-deoxy-L-arabinose transferase-like glycosyltransferase